MKLYNSLTQQKEEFVPLNNKSVGVYTCGPTVYHYVTIGNWRTYVLGDVLVRVLKELGYDVTYIMNITDVGHLTGDNEGDASTGEDRLEKAARKEGKTAWDIAEFYTKDFLAGYKKLNLVESITFTKATDHITEQIELVERLEKNGLTYKTSDGIYFDTKKYEEKGYRYGELSTLDQIQEGARVDVNPEKKDPRDFALWKFSTPEEKRHMEWESPWGVGFPGWHIECSAMSMKYLGNQFDLHVGGEDLRSTHHPNEIAQSQGATQTVPFVKYWVHGAFLQIDGGRMGKSLGNAYTLADLKAEQIHPMALKYFYFSGHYRKPLNFTWESVRAAQNAWFGLVHKTEKLLHQEKVQSEQTTTLKALITQALADDLNIPQALAELHQGIDQLSPGEQLSIITWIDSVLGLEIVREAQLRLEESESDQAKFESLLEQREVYRTQKQFDKADQIRHQIEEAGYEIIDTADGAKVQKRV